jgi:hypothetical protein
MSEAIKRFRSSSSCGNRGKICPEKAIFSDNSLTKNQSNALRLGQLILTSKKKPEIVNKKVNIFGGRHGSIGGFRGLPRNTLV